MLEAMDIDLSNRNCDDIMEASGTSENIVI